MAKPSSAPFNPFARSSGGEPSVDPAINPFGPQPGMQQPEPPTTLEAAMNAAYSAAWSELCDHLPHGLPVDELDPGILDTWICSAAIYSASEPLESFLPEPLRSATARGQTAAALYDVTVHLSTYEPDAPERMHPSSMADPSPREAHPREPWRPLDEAMKVAFAQACDEYQWDFPEDVPFEALGTKVYSLFFNRGRFVAFEVLEPVLPRETAIQMAEAIAEAAWQLRARELTNSSAPSR